MLAAVVAVAALTYWRTEDDQWNSAPAVVPPNTASEWSEAAPTPAQSAPGAAAASPQPTVAVFDFATLRPAGEKPQSTEDERFATNKWFSEEDLEHPERYFEWAERVPELRRPEERRDVLAFFIAYRAKLRRDLQSAGRDLAQRHRILNTLARYDSAIIRLRPLVEER